MAENKFGHWKKRYGQINEHNGQIPRDWWLEDWERQAIVDFHDRNPLEGYRTLAFMMLDDDIVADMLDPTNLSSEERIFVKIKLSNARVKLGLRQIMDRETKPGKASLRKACSENLRLATVCKAMLCHIGGRKMARRLFR